VHHPSIILPGIPCCQIDFNQSFRSDRTPTVNRKQTQNRKHKQWQARTHKHRGAYILVRSRTPHQLNRLRHFAATFSRKRKQTDEDRVPNKEVHVPSLRAKWILTPVPSLPSEWVEHAHMQPKSPSHITTIATMTDPNRPEQNQTGSDRRGPHQQATSSAMAIGSDVDATSPLC